MSDAVSDAVSGKGARSTANRAPLSSGEALSSGDPLSSGEAERPVLRVVRGDVTAEELAALTALIAVTGPGEPEPVRAPVRGRWNDPTHQVRRAWRHGDGGWRSAR